MHIDKSRRGDVGCFMVIILTVVCILIFGGTRRCNKSKPEDRGPRKYSIGQIVQHSASKETGTVVGFEHYSSDGDGFWQGWNYQIRTGLRPLVWVRESEIQEVIVYDGEGTAPVGTAPVVPKEKPDEQ